MSKANSCFPQQLISKAMSAMFLSKHVALFYISTTAAPTDWNSSLLQNLCIHGTGRIPSMTSTASAALASWNLLEKSGGKKNTQRIFDLKAFSRGHGTSAFLLAFNYSQTVCKVNCENYGPKRTSQTFPTFLANFSQASKVVSKEPPPLDLALISLLTSMREVSRLVHFRHI